MVSRMWIINRTSKEKETLLQFVTAKTVIFPTFGMLINLIIWHKKITNYVESQTFYELDLPQRASSFFFII